jgi:imidazolonepropionase-like amidohydrolase
MRELIGRFAMSLALLTATEALLAQAGPGDAVGSFLASDSTTFLLENLRVVDGTGAPAREGLSLLIEDGIIAAMGPSGELDVDAPGDAERIDLAGHTVLPGLVMMHEHLGYAVGTGGQDPSVDQVNPAHPNSIPKLLLAAGVTTARTAGSDAPQIDLNLKTRLDSGAAVGPTIFTGPFLNGPERAYLSDFVVRTPEEGREVVRFWVRRGATMIKVYSNIAPEVLEAVIEEAHRLGAHVAGHLGPGTSCTQAARLGIDTIEHGFAECGADIPPGWLDDPTSLDPNAPEVTRVIETLVEHGVTIVATPVQWPPSDAELAMLSASQLARYEAVRAAPPPFLQLAADPPPELRAFSRAITQAFVNAGGRMLIGADASNFGRVPGYANHTAMILMTDAFPPLDVIRMATSDAAAFLGIGERTGRIAAGLEADLLIVAGAPDIDMRDVRNVAYVFKDGRVYDPRKLREAARGFVGVY